MSKTVTAIREELADREAIRDVLLRYSRASDRVDEELLRSVYWPDATDNHLEFSGDREEFIRYCTPVLRATRYNMHMLGNMLIVIDGSRAEAETYFMGYHSIPLESGGRKDMFAGGRYLDQLERRNDEWRISKRFVTVDWYRDFPDGADWEQGPFGMGDKVTRGDLQPDDKSCSFFSLL